MDSRSGVTSSILGRSSRNEAEGCDATNRDERLSGHRRPDICGHSLADGLGVAQALFGNTFLPVDCLRALECFEDPLLDDLSLVDRTILKDAVQEVVLRGGGVRYPGKTAMLFD